LDELRWAFLIGDRTRARRIFCSAFVNGGQALTEEAMDEIIFLAKAGSGAAFRQLQRSEFRWHGLRTNYLNRLSEIKVPTLIVHGQQDEIAPVKWAERAHTLMKNSKIEVIPECGHLPPIEKPDLFNPLIRDFLSNN
jgi:pimeloyl-ACP methyl ester carboxylesterase